MKRLGLFLIGLFLMACSSAPPGTEGISERKNRAIDYATFAQTYYQQGQYAQALQFYKIALDLNTAVDNAEGIASNYNSLASVFLALNQPDDARVVLEEAEKICKRINNQALLYQTVGNYAQVDLKEGKLDQAYKRLTSIAPIGYPATKEGAVLYQALGTVEKDRGRLVEALAAYQKALDINKNLNLKQEMSANYFMIGSLKSKQGDSLGAFDAVSKALDLDRTMENTLGIGQDLRALGTITEKLGSQKDAYDYYVRSQRVFQSVGMTDERVKSLDKLIPLAITLKLADDVDRYQKMKSQLLDVDVLQGAQNANKPAVNPTSEITGNGKEIKP